MSFFSAITKYQPSTLTDPSENWLTEVLASVLRTVNPRVAIRLATYWLEPEQTNHGLGERRGHVADHVLEALGSAADVDVVTTALAAGSLISNSGFKLIRLGLGVHYLR